MSGTRRKDPFSKEKSSLERGDNDGGLILLVSPDVSMRSGGRHEDGELVRYGVRVGIDGHSVDEPGRFQLRFQRRIGLLPVRLSVL